MSMLGKGVGVLAKAVGSGSPSFVAQDPADPDPLQFKVAAHKFGDNWYLSINSGYCQRVETVTAGIISSGNRDVIVATNSIIAPTDLGEIVMHEVNEVAAHKGLRYATVANNLKLGQQYLAPEEYTYVFLYCAYPGAGVRLGVVGRDAYNTYFNYAGSGVDKWGETAVIVALSSGVLSVTKSDGYVTNVSIDYQSKSYWERVGLLVRPLATFRKSTAQLTVHNIGPQTFDHVSETYAREGTVTDIGPDVIDGNWASYYYRTGAPNAPTGYIFSEGEYSV